MAATDAHAKTGAGPSGRPMECLNRSATKQVVDHFEEFHAASRGRPSHHALTHGRLGGFEPTATQLGAFELQSDPKPPQRGQKSQVGSLSGAV